jgi:hypothetical protein
MSLKEAVRVLGFVLRTARKPKRYLPSPGYTGEDAPRGAGEGRSLFEGAPAVVRAYEPSGMAFVWGLRLGTESGGEGWYRVWRWWRDAQEIGGMSLKRFEAMAK